MATILSQLQWLRSKIVIPYTIQYVDREIMQEEFEEKVIYIHITI